MSVSVSLSLIYLFVSRTYCPCIFVMSLSRQSLTLSCLKVSLSYSLLSPTVFHSITSISCYLYPISLNLSRFCITASLFYPLLSRQSERHNIVHVSERCAVGSMPSSFGSADNVHCLLSVLRIRGKLLLFISALHKITSVDVWLTRHTQIYMEEMRKLSGCSVVNEVRHLWRHGSIMPYIRHVQRVDRDRPVDRGTIFGRSHRPIRKLHL
jgi:hypothetical protein